MRLSKDSTVWGVVLSLLVSVVVLITLRVMINRLSFNSEEFNIAEGFSYSRDVHATGSAAVPSTGDADFTNLVNEEFLEVADSSLTPEDGDTQNSSRIASVSSANYTAALPGDADALDSRIPLNSTVVLSSPPNVGNGEESSSSPGEDLLVASVPSSTSGVSDKNPHPNPWDRSEAKRQRVFQPASLPHYAFVKFSAYRYSLRTFFITGITSYVARAYDRGRIVHTCEWHPGDDSRQNFVESEANHIYWKTDENSGTYNPTTINCTFGKDVGADRMGGWLVLRISTGYDRWDRNLPVVAMEELAGEVDVVLTPPEKVRPKFKFALCLDSCFFLAEF